MEFGDCKFCGKWKELVDSHIIPRSLYPKNASGDIGMKIVPLDKKAPAKGLANGYSDSKMVCRACEDLFDPYDSYINVFFRHVETLPFEVFPDVGRFRNVFDYDARKLKLFFLSLLWRAHATDLPAFSAVNLGKYADIIRDLIKNGDPGPADSFSVFILSIEKKENAPVDMSTASIPPTRQVLETGLIAYDFWLFGYRACITVGNRPTPRPYSDIRVGLPPPLPIIEWDGEPTILALAKSALRNTRAFHADTQAQRDRRNRKPQ